MRSLGHGPIGASADVYKNGDFVKSVTLGGAATPVTSHSYSVSGLPSGYWPTGTITITSINHPNRGIEEVRHAPHTGDADLLQLYQEALRDRGKTPAEAALINVDCRNKWRTLIQNAALYERVL